MAIHVPTIALLKRKFMVTIKLSLLFVLTLRKKDLNFSVTASSFRPIGPLIIRKRVTPTGYRIINANRVQQISVLTVQFTFLKKLIPYPPNMAETDFTTIIMYPSCAILMIELNIKVRRISYIIILSTYFPHSHLTRSLLKMLRTPIAIASITIAITQIPASKSALCEISSSEELDDYE